MLVRDWTGVGKEVRVRRCASAGRVELRRPSTERVLLYVLAIDGRRIILFVKDVIRSTQGCYRIIKGRARADDRAPGVRENVVSAISAR